MPIKPGSLSNFNGSMAAAIEAQLDAMLDPHLPMDNSAETRDRRKLLVAIARGVVEHLHQHQTSMGVSYLDDLVARDTSVALDVDWT